MKPGRVTCAGLIGIMMVMPSSIWKKEPPQAAVPRVIVYETSVDAAEQPPPYPAYSPQSR